MKIKIITILMCCIVALSLTGCNKKEEEKNEESTVATSLASVFEKEIKKEKDIVKLANTISENDIIKTSMVVEEKTNKDYLNGFDKEIVNFKSAAVIQPMIGSIPFIAYIFETDNPENLEKELKENANLRWNICVEAEEMKIKVVDKYVFFIMSPKSFEE